MAHRCRDAPGTRTRLSVPALESSGRPSQRLAAPRDGHNDVDTNVVSYRSVGVLGMIRKGMKVSIVVPAFNEAGGLAATLASIRAAAAAFEARGWAHELIVCDNNSTDATAESPAPPGRRSSSSR